MLDLFGNLEEHQQRIREKLSGIVIQHTSAEGAIKVEIDGNRRIRDIQIDASHFDPVDWEEVQDLLVIALNGASEKAEQEAAKETQKAINDMMPGLGGLGNLLGS